MLALTTKENGQNDNDEEQITRDEGRLLYFLLKGYYLF